MKTILLISALASACVAAEPTLFVGGCGGVYFLAEPGELVVEVEKRDLNRRDTRTELRAILAGPDRRVLKEAVIPDDGKRRGSGLGPVQSCRLSTRVERKGVYVLNVTVSNDRYGENVIWGFRSNCPKYLIETARGHRDARHEEPIVLASPDRPADVCFLPRQGTFSVEVTGLPKGAAPPQMFDSTGALVATLDKPSHEFTAKVAALWRLHFPSAQASIAIDGVTRWENRDPHPNMAIWTPDPKSWFPFLENRWLLTPDNQTVHGQKEIAFQVRNDSRRERTIQLSAEPPVKLSVERVTLGRGKAATVMVAAATPGIYHLCATPLDDSGFTTYSTLIVKSGEAPATKPLNIPILLKPYQHENEQFGYLSDFPTANQLYFDLQNRPFVRTGGSIATLRNDQWVAFNAGSGSSSKITFDKHDTIYILTTAGLSYSTDGGKTFASCPIPRRGRQSSSFDIEEFTGHNILDGPPPILRYTLTAKDDKLFWRRLNDLELFLPRKVDGRIVMGEPILITKQCIGLADHSGIPSSVVSKGNKVHIIGGEATDPKEKVPGLPAYVATYDRKSKQLSKPALVGYGAPANDVHNAPSITMDSKGFLHALGGTHGRPFPYARSLKPNDAGSGWTEAVFTGEDLSQTYIGMVCGPDDALHSAFRLWRRSMEPFPASSYGTLAYQRKRPGQPWEPPRVLIVPPFSEYSVYYHRLTIDRKGRLFLSYDYWSTHWFYRNDRLGRRRTVLMSPDGGDTWKLVETKDLKP